MKTKSIFYLGVLAIGSFSHLWADNNEPQVVATQLYRNFEVTLTLESPRSTVGMPVVLQLRAKNIGKTQIRLGHDLVFLQNFHVNVFNLTHSVPVALTAHGESQQRRLLRHHNEFELQPGAAISYLHPMLGWDFDLSMPARYRVEVTWFPGTIQTKPQKIEPLTLAVEFEVTVDPTLRPMLPRDELIWPGNPTGSGR